VRGCVLCETEAIEPGELNKRLVEDYWPGDAHPDYLGLKREIESEYKLSLSVTTLKTHLNDHIRWIWGGAE